MLKSAFLRASLRTNFMVLRVAVTGGTGFVGQALLKRLRDSAFDVRLLVRPQTRIDPAPGQVVVRGTLQDVSALKKLTDGIDVVIHLAGVISALRIDDYMAANRDGTQRLAEAAITNAVARFVQVSSLAAREPTLNGYAASKAAAEAILSDYSDRMQIVVLRPSAVYGPGDKATLPLLKALLSRFALLPGSAHGRFSMIHVDDLVSAIIAAATATQTGVFDVDDGQGGHSWPELLGITQRCFGRPQRHAFIPRAVAMTIGRIGDGLGRLAGKPAMINSDQLKQVYHPNWQSTGRTWPLAKARQLHDALPETVMWYQAQGLLPPVPRIDRSPAV